MGWYQGLISTFRPPEGNQTHRKVAVVPRVRIQLRLQSVRQSLPYMLSRSESRSERSMERGRRVVVPNEGVFAKSGESVDELRRGLASLFALANAPPELTARLIHAISSSQSCRLSFGLRSGGA